MARRRSGCAWRRQNAGGEGRLRDRLSRTPRTIAFRHRTCIPVLWLFYALRYCLRYPFRLPSTHFGTRRAHTNATAHPPACLPLFPAPGFYSYPSSTPRPVWFGCHLYLVYFTLPRIVPWCHCIAFHTPHIGLAVAIPTSKRCPTAVDSDVPCQTVTMVPTPRTT